MSAVVLDASALLALLNEEPGHAVVTAALPSAVIGTVNLAEVVGKLAEVGVPAAAIDEALSSLAIETVDFDGELARAAGLLRPATRGRGLSLGDRACLALALRLRAPALTTDRAWAELDLGVEVRLARPAT